MNKSAQQIQALLFLAGDSVSKKELRRLVECTASEVNKHLSDISDSLADHGLTLVTTNTHAQLVTSPAVSQFVTSFITSESSKLTAAASETLSIIAYRGPIDRPAIDLIRGVDSRRLVRQLASRGLIKKTLTKNRLIHYAITEEFLNSLGLTNVDQLPDYNQLSSSEKVDKLLDTKQ